MSSDVLDQPMSDPGKYDGARNRSINLKKEFPDGDFRVGIEGGIEVIKNDRF